MRAHLVLVYGDAEAGAEGDVEVAVAQGGAKSAACGRASSRSCSISSVNSTPSRRERVAAARCSLAATLTPRPHAVPIYALQAGGFGDRRDLLGLVQAARLGDLDVDDVRRLRADDLTCTTSCGVQAYSP